MMCCDVCDIDKYFIAIFVILVNPCVCGYGFHLQWLCILHGSRWWNRYECL